MAKCSDSNGNGTCCPSCKGKLQNMFGKLTCSDCKSTKHVLGCNKR